MAEESCKCPECDISQLKSDCIRHFQQAHQAKETDMTRNPYISFPHEQIPRLIEANPADFFPHYRERFIEVELIQFYQAHRLPIEDFESQKQIYSTIKRLVESEYPGICRVDAVTEQYQGLATRGSYFDIVVRLSKLFLNDDKQRLYSALYPDDLTRKMRIASNFLQRILPQLVSVDPKAAVYYLKSFVPLPQSARVRPAPGSPPPTTPQKLKFVGVILKADKFMFDISAYNDLSFLRAQLIQAYAQLHPYVSILIVIVKAWAERRRISGKLLGKLSPFCFSVMVIHFLQNYSRRPLLPVLQKGVPGGVFKREASEEEKRTIGAFSESLAKLAYEFFQYYSSFDWNTLGISIRQTGFVANTDPGYPILIQNPLPPYDNLADHFQDKSSIVKIKNEFRRAFSFLNFNPEALREPKAFESQMFSVIMDPDGY